jgi:hypothetical protein
MFDVLNDDMEPVARGELYVTEEEAIAYALIDLPNDDFVYLVGRNGRGDIDVTAMVFQGMVWRPEVEE